MEQETQTPSLTVWCGVGAKGILGPYFFEEGGRSATVTAAHYKRMLECSVVPEIVRRGVALNKVWWQQDGATPHTTSSVLNFLEQTFPGKVLSKRGSVQWPPRSPDLTLPDFFPMGSAEKPGLS